MKIQKEIRHLSLFSGCGGIDIGLNGNFKTNNNFIINSKNNNKYTLLPRTKFKTVFANDIKKSSYNFWKKNLIKDHSIFKLGSIVDLVKEHKKKGDIFPSKIDILTGGFPCQDFSVSGLRKGFKSHKSHLNNYKIINKNETRGKLYLWMKEVIKITNPKIFIAENVKGLVSMKDVFEIIKKDFKNTGSGYKIYAKELYAPDYGIPQSRKRIFFIGICEKFIKKNKLNLTEKDLFPDVEFSKIKKQYPKAKFFFKNLKEPELENKDLSQMYYSKAKYTKGTQGQIEVNENGIAPTIRSEHHGNIEFRFLKKKNGGKNINPKNKQRRLTVRECARIQTFPDNLKFIFNIGSKDGIAASNAYKLIGDAVPPLLAYKIAKKLEKIIIKFS
jgi:DNA (cytosine-5)-methyltransferase 1